MHHRRTPIIALWIVSACAFTTVAQAREATTVTPRSNDEIFVTHYRWFRAVRSTVVRQGVRKTAPITGMLRAGELIKVLREPNASTAQIQSESGTQGYVLSDDLRPAPTAQVDASASAKRAVLSRQSKPIEPVFLPTSSASSDASTSDSSHSLAPQPVPQSSRSDGGSSQSDVGSYSSSSSISSQSSHSSLFRVTSPQLHLRLDSRAESYNLQTLRKGDTLEVLQMLKNGWAKVKVANGKEGFVHAGFIERVIGE